MKKFTYFLLSLLLISVHSGCKKDDLSAPLEPLERNKKKTEVIFSVQMSGSGSTPAARAISENLENTLEHVYVLVFK